MGVPLYRQSEITLHKSCFSHQNRITLNNNQIWIAYLQHPVWIKILYIMKISSIYTRSPFVLDVPTLHTIIYNSRGRKMSSSPVLITHVPGKCPKIHPVMEHCGWRPWEEAATVKTIMTYEKFSVSNSKKSFFINFLNVPFKNQIVLN